MVAEWTCSSNRIKEALRASDDAEGPLWALMLFGVEGY